ncbi:MAG: zf-HC2 domain-containing protein [Chloroflexota bacterium]
MSRIRRLRSHRTGTRFAAHDRARALAAERLDGPLSRPDAAWLSEHLAACHTCRVVANGYESDRVALRAMRDRTPEPPRDLWARTAAAIERESETQRGRPRRRTPGRTGPALGVLSGVAVIAVVIGASLMSGGWLNGPATGPGQPTAPPVALASTSARPGATPMAVGAGSVGWVGTSADGRLAYNVAAVDEVCPVERQPDCAEIADRDSRHVELTIRPKSISQSPVRNEAVVVGSDGSGSDSVLVISLPTAEPSRTPSPTRSPSPTPKATPTSTPVEASIEPSASTEPSGSASEAPASATPEATATASATPIEPTARPTATPEPTETPEATVSPTSTPSATLVANLAIVSGVKVVGQSASYSPDGSWFAFTARPSDGSSGPDIYVWRVGDELARQITDDHSSVFGSWAGNRLVGSRPLTGGGAAGIAATSFVIDPATGKETAMDAPVWRPIVDPERRWAVTWDGTLRVDSATHIAGPDKGTLVLRGYSRSGGVANDGPREVLADGAASDFDVRWDETGTWLAVWLADTTDPSIGRLSLVRVDPVSGALDRPHGAPQDVTALPGFSIANGRLAWATPPGQGGEGSRLQIVAWTDDSVGAVESGPITNVVVIH